MSLKFPSPGYTYISSARTSSCPANSDFWHFPPFDSGLETHVGCFQRVIKVFLGMVAVEVSVRWALDIQNGLFSGVGAILCSSCDRCLLNNAG